MRILLILLCFAYAHSFAEEEISVERLPDARERFDSTGYKGTILVYDLKNDTYYSSNPGISTQRFIPASTFKILSTQAALQSKVVASKEEVLTWDGIQRSRTETNRDLDFTTAFRISSVPHYQAIVRKIGTEQMQAYLDSTNYGNRDLSGGIDQFWLTGGLRISPQEQVEFLKRLYQNDLPFDLEVMSAVREMMRVSESPGDNFWAKTGWAVLPDNLNVGWWVGWTMRKGQPIFFATVLESNNPRSDFGQLRIDLAKSTLESMFSASK